MKKYIILYIIFSTLNSVFAVTDTIKYPVIGERCPDFLLSGVQQFHKKEVRLDDFKGKWLIMDFWGEYCSACVKSFPEMNKIYQKFSKDIEILMVGIPSDRKNTDPNSIRLLYEKHRQKLDLKMPIVFDGKLAAQFAVKGYPHIVVVDPDGIVRYVTLKLTEENVQDMIDNKPVTLIRKYNAFEVKSYDFYDLETPFLLGGNGGDETDYFYRSILAKTTDGTRPLEFLANSNRLEMLGFPLANFYQYAYLGNYANEFHIVMDSAKYVTTWPLAVIEVKDTALFKSNSVTKENLFSYTLHFPVSNINSAGKNIIDIRNILKKELDLLFPYIVTLENRLMPYYKVHINEKQLDLLKSKSTSKRFHFEWVGGKGQGFRIRNHSLTGLVSHITGSSGYKDFIPMLIDGKDLNIDLEVHSVYFDDMIKELYQKGIEITKEQKEMTVLVVRDK